MARQIFVNDEYLIDLDAPVAVGDNVRWGFELGFEFSPLDGVLPPDDLRRLWFCNTVEPDPDDDMLVGKVIGIREIRIQYEKIGVRTWDFVEGSARLLVRPDAFHHLADPWTPEDQYAGYLIDVDESHTLGGNPASP